MQLKVISSHTLLNSKNCVFLIISSKTTSPKEGNDKNYNIRNFQERAAINAPIQGSASEIMRIAMIRLNKKLDDEKYKNCKMLLQIHDELIFEIPKKK